MAKRKMTQGEQNLLLLEKLLPGNEKFYVWCYAPEGRCVAASCPKGEKDMLDQAFRVFGGEEKAEAYRTVAGNRDYYSWGEHTLQLQGDENGILASIILAE